MVQANVVAEVGRRIRELRLARPARRRTQQDLCGRARISVSFLSMIERGERSASLTALAKIASALEVELHELFSFSARSEASRVEAIFQPLLEACRQQKLGRREVDRLVLLVRSMFA